MLKILLLMALEGIVYGIDTNLPQMRADLNKTTISGFNSGASMVEQMQVIYSEPDHWHWDYRRSAVLLHVRRLQQLQQVPQCNRDRYPCAKRFH
jgi:hypothetical protein